MLLTIIQWHADCIDVGAFKVVIEWQTLIRKQTEPLPAQVLTAVYSVSSTHVTGS